MMTKLLQTSSMQTIDISTVNIIQPISENDNGRRTETLENLTNLDDLHKELVNLGFKFSHSSVYVRVCHEVVILLKDIYKHHPTRKKPLQIENRLNICKIALWYVFHMQISWYCSHHFYPQKAFNFVNLNQICEIQYPQNFAPKVDFFAQGI